MAVDQGDGDLAREILFRQRQRRRARGDDHPGDVIAQQLFKRGGELLRIVSVHQQRHKAIERQLMDQRRQQFAAKRVVETGGDDADKITAAGDHRPGDDIHLIARASAALSTFCRVFSDTEAPGVKVRETAERETPASLATSSALIHFYRSSSFRAVCFRGSRRPGGRRSRTLPEKVSQKGVVAQRLAPYTG